MQATQSEQELKIFRTEINYTSDYDKIKTFLLFFTEKETPKYMSVLKSSTDTITIDLKDILLYDDSGLCSRIMNNGVSYLNLFYKAIDSIIYDSDDFLLEEKIEPLLYHRIARLKEKFPNKKVTDVLPTPLLRNYSIILIPVSSVYTIRDLKSSLIGKLIKIKGIVTRITQIKPNIRVCTYVCESCGSETFLLVANDEFNMLDECNSAKCKLRNYKGTLHLQTRASKFVKSQTIKLQELISDTPKGCIPRNVTVECFNNLTEIFKPGDNLEISGIFLPKPYTGYRKLKAGLLSDTFFLALSTNLIETSKNEELKTELQFSDVVNFFAPEIYGLEDVKKILLLQLLGAPTLKKSDGMKIRGEINVLLLGDPGIAKSQLLKTVTKIAKRSVYTTGKGTSGVGLTASILKDPLTNEMILEGGALVLSDLGICCIDELDKMEENDRVSLHEVMEQQTISISKAGINTTLNARCSVLAAANPIKGKYNVKKSVEYNVGLPCALISRFDVIVVIRDLPNEEKDLRLAKHITNLHVKNEDTDYYNEIKNMVEKAKEIQPLLTEEIKKILIQEYCLARQKNNLLTPRYLLSLIRLTMANARFRFSSICTYEDAKESIRLIKLTDLNSKNSMPTKHTIYNLVIDFPSTKRDTSKVVRYEDLKKFVLTVYSEEEFEECVNEFVNLGVWVRNGDELVIFN